MRSSNNPFILLLIVFMVGLNIGLAYMVNILKVPIYLDAVGTIIITILVGLRAGIFTGVLSFVMMTITGVGPYHIYFSGTQVVIAIVIYLFALRGFFQTIPKTIFVGIILGVCAAIVSAPVIVYLFGGIEGNGPGLVTSFLVATGKTITQSVILKGVSIEPVDKSIQCVLSFILIKGIPDQFLRVFDNKVTTKNFIK